MFLIKISILFLFECGLALPELSDSIWYLFVAVRLGGRLQKSLNTDISNIYQKNSKL